MRVYSHRTIRGATVHRDGPTDRLVVADFDVTQATGLPVKASSAGELVGKLATYLQSETGQSETWHQSWQDADGDWIVLTAADDVYVANAAASAACQLIKATLGGNTIDVAAALNSVMIAGQANSTVRLLEKAAAAADVPSMELGADYIQLGWGVHRRTFWGSMRDSTSGLGYEIANDHERSKIVLEDRGIPVPRFEAVTSWAGTQEVAEDLQYPVTSRPLRGPGGVTRDIRNVEDLEAAYDLAKTLHRWVVVEDHVHGDVHRIIVHDGQVIAAVTEHGKDVLSSLHPAVAFMACRAARIAGVDFVAVEIIADHLEAPLEDTRGKFVAMQPCPDLASFPGGPAVAATLVESAMDGNGRIPLIAVTGTNGKTTTVRLLSHILKFSGERVGMACTGAIEVENQVILQGDYSGPAAARTVLREPRITAAVCEVARGGLLSRGLGFDKCDVAVFLNVGADHLGSGGIETVEDLAQLKAVVTRAATEGTVVLNADDNLVWKHRPSKSNFIPFSMDPQSARLAKHLAAAPENAAVTIENEIIQLRRGGTSFAVCPVIDIPITLDGSARFNVANAMAAVGAAYALGLTEEDTRAALKSFNPSMGQLPGRMNLIQMGGVKVLLDYGHNVPALEALAETLPRLSKGKRINVANASGNRRDVDLQAFGQTIAGMYDRIILCDPDPRGRDAGETAEQIQRGIEKADFPKDQFTLELDEAKALKIALAESRPGDLVVLQADNINSAISLLNEIRGRLDAGESPADLNLELLTS